MERSTFLLEYIPDHFVRFRDSSSPSSLSLGLNQHFEFFGSLTGTSSMAPMALSSVFPGLRIERQTSFIMTERQVFPLFSARKAGRRRPL